MSSNRGDSGSKTTDNGKAPVLDTNSARSAEVVFDTKRKRRQYLLIVLFAAALAIAIVLNVAFTG